MRFSLSLFGLGKMFRGRAGGRWSALKPLSNDGQRILAGGAIAREVGAARSRHRISYLVHQLGRNVAQLGFQLGNRFWCWLMVPRRRRGLRAPRPGRCDGLEVLRRIRDIVASISAEHGPAKHGSGDAVDSTTPNKATGTFIGLPPVDALFGAFVSENDRERVNDPLVQMSNRRARDAP